MKLRAFTLAELLIALSIIGLIMVLTLPQVFDNMINKNNVASLQRVYIALSDSVKRMLQDEATKDVSKTYLCKNSGDTVSTTAGTFIKKYFKLAVDCGTNRTPCFADSYKTFDKSTDIQFPSDGNLYCATLATKASMCIVPPTSSAKGIVFVDVNAAKTPNIAGKDLFTFYIYPDGYVGDRQDNSSSCSNNKYGFGCFNKLAKSNWVMDY